jgi:hypothetical protein
MLFVDSFPEPLSPLLLPEAPLLLRDDFLRWGGSLDERKQTLKQADGRFTKATDLTASCSMDWTHLS